MQAVVRGADKMLGHEDSDVEAAAEYLLESNHLDRADQSARQVRVEVTEALHSIGQEIIDDHDGVICVSHAEAAELAKSFLNYAVNGNRPPRPLRRDRLVRHIETLAAEWEDPLYDVNSSVAQQEYARSAVSAILKLCNEVEADDRSEDTEEMSYKDYVLNVIEQHVEALKPPEPAPYPPQSAHVRLAALAALSEAREFAEKHA